MARPRVADGGTHSSMEGICEYIGIISGGHPTRGGPSAWGSSEVLTTHRRKNLSCYEPFTKALVNAVMNLRVP